MNILKIASRGKKHTKTAQMFKCSKCSLLRNLTYSQSIFIYTTIINYIYSYIYYKG